jgi:hypothetical protein
MKIVIVSPSRSPFFLRFRNAPRGEDTHSNLSSPTLNPWYSAATYSPLLRRAEAEARVVTTMNTLFMAPLSLVPIPAVAPFVVGQSGVSSTINCTAPAAYSNDTAYCSMKTKDFSILWDPCIVMGLSTRVRVRVTLGPQPKQSRSRRHNSVNALHISCNSLGKHCYITFKLSLLGTSILKITQARQRAESHPEVIIITLPKVPPTAKDP